MHLGGLYDSENWTVTGHAQVRCSPAEKPLARALGPDH
jgi:hypothetical protein